jgi:hypothetical protein
LNKNNISPKIYFIFIFLFLYLFRTAFGLSLKFWTADELQTYLIGLKWFTTHNWPFFGPDLIVDDTHFYFQIPGALDGLMVGSPLFLLPIPEAPFLFLNLLSLMAIALLAFYIHKRVPEIPFLFTFTWISLLPWTLNDAAHMYNPCYLLFGSVLFFIGFLEAVPSLSINWLSPAKAFALMGFGLFWDMQLHFSWILLPPLALAALTLSSLRNGWKSFPLSAGAFFAGCLVPLAALIPTLVVYGIQTLFGGVGTTVGFNPHNASAFFVILARYLSLPCFEMPQFLGEHTVDRLAFLKDAPWLILPGVFLWFTGLLQPFVFLIFGWRPRNLMFYLNQPVFGFTWLMFLMVYGAFCFTYKAPVAHALFILFPLVTVFSFHVWAQLAVYPFWRNFALVCLVMSLWFQLGFLIYWMPKRSLYLDRAKIQTAIDQKNYRLLAERRPQALY